MYILSNTLVLEISNVQNGQISQKVTKKVMVNRTPFVAVHFKHPYTAEIDVFDIPPYGTRRRYGVDSIPTYQKLGYNDNPPRLPMNVWNSYASGGVITMAQDMNVRNLSGINDSQWRHIAWVIDPNGTWTVYFDGNAVATYADGMYPASSGTFIRSRLGERFFGHIDGFHMFNRVLNGNEIRYGLGNTDFQTMSEKMSVNPLPAPTIRMDFKDSSVHDRVIDNDAFTTMTEAFGTISNDSGDNRTDLWAVQSNHITLSGTKYIKLDPWTTDKFNMTFMCWFLSRNNQTWARIFDFGNGASADNIVLSVWNDQLVAYVFIGANYNYQIIPVNINDGRWHHVAWTMSYNGTWTIFIDGNTVVTTTDFFFPTVMSRTNNYLGKSNWPDSYFQGNLADFRYIPGFASVLDVQAVYNNGIPINSFNQKHKLTLKDISLFFNNINDTYRQYIQSRFKSSRFLLANELRDNELMVFPPNGSLFTSELSGIMNSTRTNTNGNYLFDRSSQEYDIGIYQNKIQTTLLTANSYNLFNDCNLATQRPGLWISGGAGLSLFGLSDYADLLSTAGYPTTTDQNKYTQPPYDTNGMFQGGGSVQTSYVSELADGTTMTGEWIQCKLPFVVIPTRYTLASNFRKFSILASVDAKTWTVLTTETLNTPLASYTSNDIRKFKSTMEGIYIRIVVHEVFSNLTDYVDEKDIVLYNNPRFFSQPVQNIQFAVGVEFTMYGISEHRASNVSTFSAPRIDNFENYNTTPSSTITDTYSNPIVPLFGSIGSLMSEPNTNNLSNTFSNYNTNMQQRTPLLEGLAPIAYDINFATKFLGNGNNYNTVLGALNRFNTELLACKQSGNSADGCETYATTSDTLTGFTVGDSYSHLRTDYATLMGNGTGTGLLQSTDAKSGITSFGNFGTAGSITNPPHRRHVYLKGYFTKTVAADSSTTYTLTVSQQPNNNYVIKANDVIVINNSDKTATITFVNSATNYNVTFDKGTGDISFTNATVSGIYNTGTLDLYVLTDIVYDASNNHINDVYSSIVKQRKLLDMKIKDLEDLPNSFSADYGTMMDYTLYTSVLFTTIATVLLLALFARS